MKTMLSAVIFAVLSWQASAATFKCDNQAMDVELVLEKQAGGAYWLARWYTADSGFDFTNVSIVRKHNAAKKYFWENSQLKFLLKSDMSIYETPAKNWDYFGFLYLKSAKKSVLVSCRYF